MRSRKSRNDRQYKIEELQTVQWPQDTKGTTRDRKSKTNIKYHYPMKKGDNCKHRSIKHHTEDYRLRNERTTRKSEVNKNMM